MVLLQTKDVLLVTRLKKGMKNILIPIKDKILLYKRSIIESIFGKWKIFGKLWHTRHRSIQNAFTHLLSCFIVYQLNPTKPKIALP